METDRDKKGQFAKGNKAKEDSGNSKNKIIATHQVGLDNRPPPIPREKDETDIDFEPFREFGDNNLFPNALAMLNRRGSTHRAIQFYKSIFTIGNGFRADDNIQVLQDLIKMVNGDMESMRKMYKKLIRDFNGFGNSYMEVVTDSNRSFLSLFHRDATKIRLAKNIDAIIIHPNWRRYRGHQGLQTVIPLYPEFEESDDGMLHSIVHFKEYEPEFVHYGLPSWVAAMDAVAIGYKTNKWNVSRLDNSFQMSGILEVFTDKADKKIKDLDKFLDALYKGEGNNAKLFKIQRERGGETTKFTPFVQNAEGEFINLHTQSDSELITAHNWFRSLSGIADNTGFDTQRIKNEYAIARTTVIPEINNFFLETIRMVIEEELAVDASSLNIELSSPLSVIDRLDPNFFVRKKEGRELLNLELDPKDPKEDEFIKNGPDKQQEPPPTS